MAQAKNKKTARKATKAARNVTRHQDVLVTARKHDDKTLASIPVQAAIIVKLATRKGGMLRTALIAALPKAGLQTRQTPLAIWSFYRSKLENKGIIKCTAVQLDAPAAKTAKPRTKGTAADAAAVAAKAA